MPRRDQSPDIDEEESPLIAAQDTNEDADVLETSLTETIGVEDSITETKSVWYLILLTLSIGGLQIVWSVELSNGSPFLLSLGMSKALMAVVWLAGPLSGVLVQPYIGIISDRSRIRWGKRRPFMLIGTIGTVITSLVLSYSKEIVWVLGPWSNQQSYEGGWKVVTIALAALMMWCLDFAINCVQAAIRAFIVDNAPAHQQESANAWASRFVGFGNVIGYVFGYIDLPKHFWFLGNTQFKILCVIASISLTIMVVISCLTIKERNPQNEIPAKDETQASGIIGFFKQVFHSIRRLSPRVRSVCQIQFCHWLAWFPFLFYTTTYIGQLYVDPRLTPGMSSEEIDALWNKATRVGTLALLAYAIVSFVANIVLPLLVVSSYRSPTSSSNQEGESFLPLSRSRGLDQTGSQRLSHQPLTSSDIYNSEHKSLNVRPSLTSRILKRLQIPGLTLRRTWMLSQILHALCCFSTFFISSTLAGTIMVAFVGIVWSLSLWAPFALISADIAKRTEQIRNKQRQKLITGDGQPGTEDASKDDIDNSGDEEHRAGIILGLHNVAVSAPQVIATLISSLVFKLLQKDRGVPGDTSVAWTLRLGGIAALGAAFLTWRMREAADERR